MSIFLYGDADELDHELLDNFPKLEQGGGYELMRSSEKGGKHLSVIQMPSEGYTPEYLKFVVSSAKIYIRPIQKDLDLTPVEVSPTLNVNFDSG